MTNDADLLNDYVALLDLAYAAHHAAKYQAPQRVCDSYADQFTAAVQRFVDAHLREVEEKGSVMTANQIEIERITGRPYQEVLDEVMAGPWYPVVGELRIAEPSWARRTVRRLATNIRKARANA